jgi:hypothetical protein
MTISWNLTRELQVHRRGALFPLNEPAYRILLLTGEWRKGHGAGTFPSYFRLLALGVRGYLLCQILVHFAHTLIAASRLIRYRPVIRRKEPDSSHGYPVRQGGIAGMGEGCNTVTTCYKDAIDFEDGRYYRPGALTAVARDSLRVEEPCRRCGNVLLRNRPSCHAITDIHSTTT